MNASPFLSEPLVNDVPKAPGKLQWEDVYDLLMTWADEPPSIEHEGLISPTRGAISRAIDTARVFAERNGLPPDRVVPNGEGGIAFERDSDEASIIIEFDAAGTSFQIMVIQSGKLLENEVVNIIDP